MIHSDRHFKIVKPESPLLLDLQWSDRVLAAVAAGLPGPLLPANGENGRFLVRNGESIGYWAAWLTDAPTLWDALPGNEVRATYIGVAEAVSAQLWGLGVPDLQTPNLFNKSMDDLLNRSRVILLKGDGVLRSICPQSRQAAAQVMLAAQTTGIVTDSVAHGDLHPGNVLLFGGRPRVIDLENLRPAPAFTDLIYGSAWARHDPETWQLAMQNHSKLAGRQPDQSDVAVAFAIMLMQAHMASDAAGVDIANAIHWVVHLALEKWVEFPAPPVRKSCF
jgi:hypothetical protein